LSLDLLKRRNHNMRKCLVILFCLMGLAASQEANATSFDLTSDHCTDATGFSGGGCGPDNAVFGTVTVTQNGTAVDITVHLNSPYAFANTGSADGQAFKFNAVGVTLLDITVDAHTPLLGKDTGAFNGDGTGTFGFGIFCPGCGGGLSDSFTSDIVFHVANATIAELTAPNAAGNIFVADIGNAATGFTGPVDSSAPVPDGGSTVALLGSVLLGLGVLRRRFGKS